jgi:pilus assembly protein CpaC
MHQIQVKTRSTRRRARGFMLAVISACCPPLLASTVLAQEAPPPTSQPASGGSIIASGADVSGDKITLATGQSRVIHTSGPVTMVAAGQNDVVYIKTPSPTEIVLTAHRPGSTDFVLADDRGRVQTFQIIVSADVSGINEELRKAFPNAKIEVGIANGTIVLHGRVPDARTADQVVQLATPFSGGAKVVDLLEISGGQQVMLQVRFAEVDKTATRALGVNFGITNGKGTGFGGSIIGGVAPIGAVPGSPPASIPGSVLGLPSPGTNVTQWGAGIAGKTPFEVFLTALKENDLLRVLAEPNLTVMSGSQASFMAGGEYPYPVPQNSGTSGSATITLDYKPYGVRLNFMPVVLGDGRIRLHVQPEVSDLDYTNTINLNGFVIPGLTKRNADTTVELGEGQTLALAGLLNNRVTANQTSTPLLGDLPIIGALFRSVRYVHQETELVVLVTPRLVGAMNPDQVPAATGERWRYPNDAQIYVSGDMGGPMADTAHAPSSAPPRQFHGNYGFTPATAPAADGR